MFWGSGSVETTQLRAGTQSLKEMCQKKNSKCTETLTLEVL